MDLFGFLFFVVVLLRTYALSLHIDRRARPGRRVRRDVNCAGVSTEPRRRVRRDVNCAGVSTEPPTVWGAAPPAGGDIERDSCLTEALLVARRLAGDPGPTDYRRAMAELAAQDVTYHPVVVPRDPAA